MNPLEVASPRRYDAVIVGAALVPGRRGTGREGPQLPRDEEALRSPGPFHQQLRDLPAVKPSGTVHRARRCGTDQDQRRRRRSRCA